MNNYNYQVQFGPAFTPIVRILVIINSAIFLLQVLLELFDIPFLIQYFALNTLKVNHFYFHQLITYSFLHGDFFHLLFNMLFLWYFGGSLEILWGRKNFLYFFFASILTGSLLTWIVYTAIGSKAIVLGASAGVFGVMVAYAMIWPDREVLFMMMFPIKMKYLVFLIMIPMSFFSRDGNTAHLAHLGGILFGFFYWFVNKKYRFEFDRLFDLDDFIRRRKFKMYQEEMNNRLRAKDRVDELLEKISKKGYNSLSRQEKKFLNEASEKYYDEK